MQGGTAMDKRVIMRRICSGAVCFLVLLFLVSACGKKEQTGAESQASVQQEEGGQDTAEMTGEPADGESAGTGKASDSTQGGETSEQNEPERVQEHGDAESPDEHRNAGTGTEDGLGADGLQDGESLETGFVRNGQQPNGKDQPDGQNGEEENAGSGQSAGDGETDGAQNPRTAENPASTPRLQAAGTTPYGTHGALSVNGTQLVDAYGAPYQLRGVSTHGLSWFPQYANKEAFRTMRDEWGVNVVRLAMYTAEYGGYCVGDQNNRNDLKQLVYDSVDAAAELGMYVIVDWHVLNDRDPNTYLDQAAAFFRETAERYAAYGNVIYEICNEPNGGVSWQSVKSYAEQIIPVIREYDADAVIIVGTPTWSQDVDQAAANPITGYQNIMYALHFYADTHRDSLRRKMVNAIGAGLPVFVSEFGICDASGNGAVNCSEADKWVGAMDENGVSYCIWNLSNKPETSALIRSDVTAVSGWSYEDLSDSGKWFVDMMGADHDVIGSTGSGGASGNAGAGGNGGSGNSGSGSAADGGAGGSASNSGAGGSGISENGSGQAQNVTGDASGSLQASLLLSNSWETDGKHYYQYSLEIQNQSGADVNGWTCELSFDCNVSVSQSWCGAFSASGSSVTITPETYNAAIGAGASQGNIGFILETDASLNVTAITCR